MRIVSVLHKRLLIVALSIVVLGLGGLCLDQGVLAESSGVFKPSEDIFYKTKGVPVGPAAHEIQSAYPSIPFVSNRVLIWVVTQQHTYFGGFVLAPSFFCDAVGVFRTDSKRSGISPAL